MADTDAIHTALALVRAGDGFAAHEALEDLWRAADPAERDLYQGLVHVAVATYQEQRGNAVGRSRQLAKAHRRLAAYEPAYEGLDIAALRDWCTRSLAAERCPPLPAEKRPASPG
jgi:predicted metal-dependent hydrolase